MNFCNIIVALGLISGSATSLLCTDSARATSILNNASFENTTLTASGRVTSADLLGWSVASDTTYLVFPGTATTGIGDGVQLWPGADGTIPSSPDGGNFIAEDGAFGGTLYQTLSGLRVGMEYSVSFWQAAAQEQGFDGPSSEQWEVGFGGGSQTSALIQDAAESFSGWRYQTLTFTADATSDVLSFVAAGTPVGSPPFALLDGVNVTAVPEPGSVGIIVSGLMTLMLARRFSRDRQPVKG